MNQNTNTFLLRLTQMPRQDGEYTVTVHLEQPGAGIRETTSTFAFEMTDSDREDIRWYLEEYLQLPADEAIQGHTRLIEARMDKIGTSLFEGIFGKGDARDFWVDINKHLEDFRVEIQTEVLEAASIPWELLRKPGDKPLALRAKSFVRSIYNARRAPYLPEIATESEPLRILLVICRPNRSEDVPFRSVATRLLKSLSENQTTFYQLDLLRPPTFERLSEKLQVAKEQNKPYHIVHFDGHGAYLDLEEMIQVWKSQNEKSLRAWLAGILKISPAMLKFSPDLFYHGKPKSGYRGYLLFDNPDNSQNLRFVDGETLGKLLRETNVPVLVLNACRSAHAEAQKQPDDKIDNVHDEVRAYGTLSQEVMDAGVAGVVGMRYNVYVVTAAQFIADMYRELAGGGTLGQAVSHGRKQLAEKPLREISYQKRELHDWCVPVVHEAAPIKLLPLRAEETVSRVTIDVGDSVTVDEKLMIKVPQPPDVGFYGRDETLLALDRAFDNFRIVLLSAFAGSGKTAVAAEFARWYIRTGGAEFGMFTSFEHKITLSGVLDQLGGRFIQNWSGLTEIEDKKNNVLKLLNQIPILWIWDNVEQVAGFPLGTKSNWEKHEQEELVEFLREARSTNTRLLLTSRRDEVEWLGKDLPQRIHVPRLFMPDRVKLARGIAKKRGRHIHNPGDWMPLLRYTDGNPLTTTVLVGQALTLGKENRDQIAEFIDQIRAGEIDISDVESEKREKSLAASLRYGYENAFTTKEQKILSLLHLFQGVVSTLTMGFMGYNQNENHLKELEGISPESAQKLLNRATEVGLLTDLGNGYYAIHPALPWFFKGLFAANFPEKAVGSASIA